MKFIYTEQDALTAAELISRLQSRNGITPVVVKDIDGNEFPLMRTDIRAEGPIVLYVQPGCRVMPPRDEPGRMTPLP